MPPPMGGPRKGGKGPIEKAKDFKGTTKKLVNEYLAKYKIALIIVMLFAVGSTIFYIVGPKILGNATTEIFNGLVNKLSGNGGINFNKVGQILLMLFGFYVISSLFSFVQNFIMTNVTQKLTYSIRKEITRKINNLPMNYFDKKTNGEVLSIITNDVDILGMNLNQSITQIITSICTLIGIAIMMLSISWQMTLISLTVMPIGGFLVKKIVGKSQKYFKMQQDYLGHVNSQVEEVFSGLTIVKAFNGEEKASEEFAKANEQLYKSAWKSQFLSGLMHPIMKFISNLGYVGIAIIGGYLAIEGKITIGNIQSFIQYNKQFSQPINQIAEISAMIQSMIAASERIFEFLDEGEEIETAKQGTTTDGLKGNVTFEHVKFGYRPEQTVIKDFNAVVHEGQKIAIVGPTGAGKTTMVKLLMRFYDVTDGAILLDGHNIKDFTRGELRQMFGMVYKIHGYLRELLKKTSNMVKKMQQMMKLYKQQKPHVYIIL